MTKTKTKTKNPPQPNSSPSRNLAELPELWHGAYCEYHAGQVFIFSRDGEAHLLSDPDELWLRLIEISKDRGAVRPTARIPPHEPATFRGEQIQHLVNAWLRKNNEPTKGPPPPRRGAKRKLPKLTLADLDL